MTAQFRLRRHLLAVVVVLAGAVVWATHHALAVAKVLPTDAPPGRLAVLYAVAYVWLVLQFGFAYLNRPARVSEFDQRELDRLHVAALVPVYNEDPAALRTCLASLIHQTRAPQQVVVVDDGSTDPEALEPVRAWFTRAARDADVDGAWVRQANMGKRPAQMRAMAYAQHADVYWTTDSDTVSEPQALGELLKPMANPRVQSVAGIMMAANIRRSLLARLYNMWFVAGQLLDRSSLSVLGAVWVNSGPIAIYRGDVLRKHARTYLTESFAGRPVMLSDDSLLTLFAMLGGRTVQQPSAFCFALMPERFGHFCRMYLRWMRGSAIRSLWRAKYLPLTSPAWWVHALRWMSLVVTTLLTMWFLALAPGTYDASAVWWLAGVPLLVGYAQALRWMVVRRSDESATAQWLTWLATPVAVVFSATVLRGLRWYGTATCWRTGWGTRTDVEVALAGADALADVPVGERTPVHTAAHGPTLLLPQVRARATVPGRHAAGNT